MTAPRLGTTCDPRSDAFARNTAAQQALVDELRGKLDANDVINHFTVANLSQMVAERAGGSS